MALVQGNKQTTVCYTKCMQKKVVAKPQITQCKNIIKTHDEFDQLKHDIQNPPQHRNVKR